MACLVGATETMLAENMLADLRQRSGLLTIVIVKGTTSAVAGSTVCRRKPRAGTGALTGPNAGKTSLVARR